MWKYVGNYDIYGCPSAGKDQYVTYSMSQSMSADPKATQTWPYLFLINQIKRPAETFVFIDTGYTGSGGFYIDYVPSLHWGDLPPVIHNQGTTFVFADGHAIYRKWTDPHTLNIISNYPGWNVDDGQGN
jgi:prepilin-type processing-associated H-X9-DG protein